MAAGDGDPLARADVRDRLIELARGVVQDLRADRQATKQAATAQAVLLRGGLAELHAVLGADYDGGGTAEHWRRFRTAFRARLGEIASAAPGAEAAAVGFSLGWIKRLGEVEAAGRPPRRDRPSPRR